MKFIITTIPHTEQRYPTVGDWLIHDDGSIEIRVSDMGNPDFEFLVGIHEAIEVYLCKKAGISQASVDAFDIAFENQREPGNVDEPGDSETAPYYKEHQFATTVEHMLAHALNVDWDTYNDTVNKL